MPDQKEVDQYGAHPSYIELAAVLAIGIGHVVIEVAYSVAAARVFNIVVSVLIIGYIIWRIRQTRGVFRIWGFRTDNFVAAMIAQSRFLVVGVIALIGYALATESPGLPKTFWLTVALYPIWGIAQQFALQNFIANNLTGLVSRPLFLAVSAALLFAVSHYPRLELVALSLVAGVFFTLIYRKTPNLWAVGTAHGLLGALTLYIVLQEDPGTMILEFLSTL